MEKSRERFWEIDFLRGLAVVLMVVVHLLADLYLFQGQPVKLSLTLWYGLQRLTAGLFLLLVGVSLTISYSKAIQKGLTSGERLKKNLHRGMGIFGWGMLVTLITRLFLQEGFVRFGVLHLIGVAVILCYPLIKLRLMNVIFGLVLLGVGIYLNHLRFAFSWLLWAGFVPRGFFSVDYFPLLPWFGLVLLGIALGNILYANGYRRFALRDWSDRHLVQGFCFLGRHSLVIYLVHQPAILFIMNLAGAI